MAKMSVLALMTVLASLSSGASIFNGSEAVILPSWTPSGCVSAFGTALNCDPALVQYLTSPDDVVGWSTQMLQSLCTSSCATSLATLYSNVRSACGTNSFAFGIGANLTFAQIAEVRQYKYNLTCLTDSSSSQFCLDVENAWNISDLVAKGTVKWPNNTAKLYPDFSSYEGINYAFPNGSSLPLSWIDPTVAFSNATVQNNAPVQNNLAGTDWYVNRSNTYYSNYGYGLPLNWDEYPLQIQCSSCFLQKFEFGISSRYGNTYDEITSQIWSNIQKNCGFARALTPANNMTGLGAANYSAGYVTSKRNLNGTSACARYLTPTDGTVSTMDFARQNQAAYAALVAMNTMDTTYVGSLPLCAPAACQVQVSNASQDTLASEFVRNLTTISLPQFLVWNPYIDPMGIQPGEAVCVGPPGGAYQPSSIAPANPTTYSTTAKAAAPTNSGTISYCGLYYNVSSGDYCNLLSQKYGITLDQLIAMNPSINTNCTNLFLGYDYCVAPCCGSSIPTMTATVTATSISSTTTTGTSSYVSAPGPTQSGANSKCYRWYVVQSGDYCYSIEQTYSITQAQFNYWNPEVDANCDIQAGYAYCVNGPPLPSSTSSAATKTA